MKKNVLSSMFALGVILISLFLLASCRPEAKVAAATLPEAAGVVSAIAPVDYEQAAANHAARWQAMAQFYADHDMLNERFDYEQAAGVVYAIDPVDLKLFNAVQTAPTNLSAAKTGIAYAMDPVDLKLFNTTETIATLVPASVDPADRKFFTGN